MAPGTYLEAEVASQPAAWSRAVDLAASHRAALPTQGQRVAAVGCGTSHFMAQVYAALRESRGLGWTDAFPASEHRDLGAYDHVVTITRSGTTTELLEVLAELRERVRTTVLVADLATPSVDLADDVIPLDFADERSVVQTRFATSALAVLRTSIGDDLGPAIEQAATLLDAPAAEQVGHLAGAEEFTFLGRGWTVGLAHEAALKLRESCQAWTESYPAMEYRHGPISIATANRVTWAFGEVPAGLAEEVRATGAHFEHGDRDPMADLVRVHRLCVERARDLGIDPDVPRHLSRSIILASR